jgi:hypothetical protein
MIQTTAGVPFEALVTGAGPGLVGTITVEVYDPGPPVTVIIAATTAGIVEVRPGTYQANLTVSVGGSFMVRWVAAGTFAEEELIVAALQLVVVTGAYATVGDLREMSGLDVARLPDARAQTLLDGAHRDIDGALGVGWRAYGPRLAGGRLVDIETLDADQADALTRATVTQAVYRELKGDAHFVASSPDDGGAVSPDAVRELDRVGLRRLTGRAR